MTKLKYKIMNKEKKNQWRWTEFKMSWGNAKKIWKVGENSEDGVK